MTIPEGFTIELWHILVAVALPTVPIFVVKGWRWSLSLALWRRDVDRRLEDLEKK